VRLLTDLRPLRESADFRRLWIGSTVSQLGQQMTAVTVSIQVYALTHSTFAVGLVGLCSLVPLIVFGLYGGAMADAIDRRTLALVSSTGLWLLSMVLVLQSHLGWGQVAVLYGVVACQSACFAVNNPARSAIIPRLIRPELLPAANTLSQAAFNLGFTAGPLLGAAVIAWQGFAAAYLVDVITFTAALYALFRLPAVPPTGAVRRAGLRSVLEGFTFLRAAPALLATFLADILAMVFAQPRALFPAVAGAFFGGGVRTVGLLQAAPAIGALIGVIFSGWVTRVRRQGVAIVLAITRTDIADYVNALFYVYILIIFLYILSNLMFGMGLRLPYSRWSDAILSFLRDVSEPYLRVFRRFIPAVGMLDFSPILAIIVLYILRAVITSLISG